MVGDFTLVVMDQVVLEMEVTGLEMTAVTEVKAVNAGKAAEAAEAAMATKAVLELKVENGIVQTMREKLTLVFTHLVVIIQVCTHQLMAILEAVAVVALLEVVTTGGVLVREAALVS